MRLASEIDLEDAVGENDGPSVRILAVIVLYRVAPMDCSSLQTLLQSFSFADSSKVSLSVLLVDNSPSSSSISESPLPKDVEYLACPANLGLANAYNRAIERAKETGVQWIITLDQDSKLPESFVSSMANHAARLRHDPSVAAILPHVVAGDDFLSPFHLRLNALPTWFEPGSVCTLSQQVYFINSAAMLRVDALEQAGGYDPWFWLDGSDTAIARRLQKLGKRAFVAGDVVVRHELSMKNMQKLLSPWRYRHILLAESALWDAEMGPLAGLERTARLAVRWLQQVLRKDDAALKNLTLKFLLLRLFRTARYRRRLFEAAVKDAIGSAFDATALPGRTPRISVCMAAYNAGTYLDAQLHSVLAQLGPDDELVVVDDCSTDGTRERIQGYGDSRIRLILHATNQGVASTVEDAARAATGDLLFFSDNDDIWPRDKVARFREAFAHDKRTLLVMSAVQLIDSTDRPFYDPQFDRNGRFVRGFWRNLLKNGYQGSAMALRKDLLAVVLPFPPHRRYMHDAWIGTVNDRIGGGMVFLPERLLLYRRHDKNVSQHMSPFKQLQARLQLLWDHIHSLFI